MIKLRKGNLIVLGLSDENIQRLQAGQPIKFNTKESLKMEDYDVLIFAGPKGATEADIAKELQKQFDIPSVGKVTSLKPKDDA